VRIGIALLPSSPTQFHTPRVLLLIIMPGFTLSPTRTPAAAVFAVAFAVAVAVAVAVGVVVAVDTQPAVGHRQLAAVVGSN